MYHPLPLLATYGLRLAAPLFPDMLWRRRPAGGERIAYLTFDDGPTPEMTDLLLDLLARYDAEATHFLIGARAERDPGRVRAMAEAGHTIGNHSFTHPDAWRTDPSALAEEMERTTGVLEAITQKPVRYLRPPYGRFTPAMRAWCQENGQRLVMWDVMPGDFLPEATPRRVERHVRRALRPGSIVVLHDNPVARTALPDALERLLGTLSDDGWRFRAL